MNLNVPITRQEKGSVDCGLCCTEMLLQYYKEPISLDEIRKELKVIKNLGINVPLLGNFFLKRGYKVEIVTLNPWLFTLNDMGMSSKEIQKRLNDLKKNESIKKVDKKNLDNFLSFLKNGGSIKVKIPDVTDIKEQIDKKSPVFVALTSHFLTGKEGPKFNLHYNLVTGLDKDFIYVNDPLYDYRGGKHKYKINDYFYGIFASAHAYIDTASIIKIWK